MAVPASHPARPSWAYVAGGLSLLALGVGTSLWRAPKLATPTPLVASNAAVAPVAPTEPEPAQAIAPRRAPGALPDEILLALGEADEPLGTARLQEALRAWAAKELDAAGEWALAQTAIHHDLALSAVIQGGANNPIRLAGFVGYLSARFPERAPDYGSYLIAALTQASAYELAATFAATADDGVAIDWLTAAYASWGRREPDRALVHLGQIADEAHRFAAFQAVVSGWARTDPAELVAVAERLSGPAQRFAMLTGMHAWIERDPAAAADWMATAPPHIEWERILDN